MFGPSYGDAHADLAMGGVLCNVWLAAVCLCDALDDRQAEPCPWRASSRVAAREAFECAIRERLRDSSAGVPDSELDRPGGQGVVASSQGRSHDHDSPAPARCDRPRQELDLLIRAAQQRVI